MSNLAQRLSEAMERAGMTQAAVGREASKYGDPVSQQVVQHLTSGRNTTSKHLLAIARALNVDIEWLIGGKKLSAEAGSVSARGGALKSSRKPGAETPRMQVAEAQRVPVLGMAECGPDGWSLWNGDVIDTIPRPSNLMGAPKAYAVYIVGDSMEPRYYAGEIAHVHPGKPVTIGAFVLVQIRPDHDGETPKAVVKRLVKRSATKLTLEQYNPPKKFELKADEIVSIHRVVGSGEF
ncbi:MAG: helix-turn-helix domain-containing protein [Alphaproteobacteria bacterium]|nr:helix-turn-helix domain-containing protein [Alphaproteobacteria bacterium]